MTDRYMLMLVRNALLKLYKNTCNICNRYFEDNYLQCHHFVKRRQALLRYDWRNNFLLCIDCHNYVHTKEGEVKLILYMNRLDYGRFEYLCQREKINIKDFLIKEGLSRNEFIKLQAKELKDIINEQH
jgi:hypothetical protein